MESLSGGKKKLESLFNEDNELREAVQQLTTNW